MSWEMQVREEPFNGSGPGTRTAQPCARRRLGGRNKNSQAAPLWFRTGGRSMEYA